MLRRTPLRVGSLLAAAAACAGVHGALVSPALAQSTGVSIRDEIAAPGAVIDRAQALADQGKLIHAYETLSDLLAGSGVDLTDAERARAMQLSAEVNRKIMALDSYEVSLQKAEYALGTEDLRAAAHHAGAVANSGTASAEQTERAQTILRSVEARQAQLGPTMRSRLSDALRALDAGHYVEAKSGLSAVSRSGVELSSTEREQLLTAQEQILMQEAARGARFDEPVAAAGMLQPGVVTRDEGGNTGGTENAGQPETGDSQSQPENQDFLQVARQLEAGSTMAEADVAFGESRWADAKAKYQRALSEFGDLLTSDQTSHAQQRIQECQLQMGSAQPGLIDSEITGIQLAASQAKAQFNNQLTQAQKALQAFDTASARDAAAAAQLTWSGAKSKQLFSEADLTAMATQLSNLKADIDVADERIKMQQQMDAENQAKRDAVDQALQRQRERSRKITEAIERVRALQMEMKYKEALQVVENQILFLDPINPSGLLLRDMLRDNVIYGTVAQLRTTADNSRATVRLETAEATIPPPGIMNYPTDWPAISALRAGVESTNESPADRRVLSALESTTLPAEFNDNTLEQALAYFGQMTGFDMDIDWASLEEIGIDKETTVSLSLKKTNARTVLERLLDKVSTDPVTQADWAVQDGMLQIASEDRIRRHTVLEMYDIRDLIFEVPNYDQAPEIDLQSVLQSSQGGGGGQSPFQTNNQQDPNRVPLQDRIDQIKEIIYRNVDEESWPEGGGTTGAMYDLNGQLLIKNTPKNHREIHSLLSKLREAKAMQINAETRFLLVAQDFFEQVGFDLDVYFNANNNQFRAAHATDPTVQPSDFFDFSGAGLNRTVSGPGTDGTGATPGPQGVVNPSPWSPIGAGQNSLGLASTLMTGDFAGKVLGEAPALGIAGQFLDDVQVDFLVKATQADRRSAALTAPRLTFTNGQTSNFYVVTQQSFVSDLQPVVSDSAVGFDPTLSVASEGVVMLVTGQVTADRRYVLLDVTASVSKIKGFAQQAVSAVAGGQLVSSSDTQSFIQLPTVTVTQVQTTVTVPDQGTVLLGGQRLVTESEVETGVPVLSKIPIINRFFSNRIQSREEQTLLILIKPTILIQNEQENNSFPGLEQSLRGLGG